MRKTFTTRRRSMSGVLVCTCLFVLPGCGIFLIDHEARAVEFCERNAEILEPAPVDEGRRYTADQADYFSEELSKTMRFAEDGTRQVRLTARDLADAYDDVREIAGDDGVPEDELEEKFGELREHRSQMRAICSELLAEQGEDAR